MDLIKCPICGEEYSPSYPSCPFCEEDSEEPRKIGFHTNHSTHHVADKRKARSARGGLIVVLIVVLALMSWYLFGSRVIEHAQAPDEEDETEQAEETIAPVVSDDPFLDLPDSTEPEPVQEPEPVTEQQPETGEPVADDPEPPPAAEVHVDASSLSVKSNYGTLLGKCRYLAAPMSVHNDGVAGSWTVRNWDDEEAHTRHALTMIAMLEQVDAYYEGKYHADLADAVRLRRQELDEYRFQCLVEKGEAEKAAEGELRPLYLAWRKQQRHEKLREALPPAARLWDKIKGRHPDDE